MPEDNKKISRNINVSIPDSLLRKVKEKAFQQIYGRINKAQEEANSKAKNIILTAIQEHPVFKGLSGKFSNFADGSDLQAEFGLTDQMRDRAIDKMMKILESTIGVEFGIEKTTTTFRIHVIVHALDPEEYYNQLSTGNEFSYKSDASNGGRSKTGITIPWMRFVLNPKQNSGTIFDGYGITYIGTQGHRKSHAKRGITALGGLNRGELNRSRSGRALMTRNKLVSRNFPYELPKILQPSSSSDNFIEDIKNNRKFRKLLSDEIKKIILKFVKK